MLSTESEGGRTWGGKQRRLMQHLAKHNSKNPKGGCEIVSNSTGDRRRGEVSNYEKRDLMTVIRGRGEIWCRYPFEKMENKYKSTC